MPINGNYLFNTRVVKWQKLAAKQIEKIREKKLWQIPVVESPTPLYERRLVAKGKKGDRIDVYLATHRNKDGLPVDEEAAKAIDAITTKLEVVPKTQQTQEFREKVFTDVLGADTHGRVRTFGKGHSPTEVFGKKNKQSHEQYARDLERAREEGRKQGREEGREERREEGLEKGHKEYRDRLERVEKILEMYNMDNTSPKYPTKKRVYVQQISDAQSSQCHQGQPKAKTGLGNLNDRADPDRQSTDSSEFLFEVGMKVDLLNDAVPKKVVAEDIIVSQDPDKKLGGSAIGEGIWVVKINKAILSNENLLIPRGNVRKVGHAIKQNVAWRKLDIKLK